MKNIYYVYIYLDTRKKGLFKYENFSFEYEPFYVGKGKGRRIRQHIYNTSKITNIERRNKINAIIKQTENLPVFFKISENLTNKKANELEKKIIKLIGRKDLNEGVLLNKTHGGDGSDTSKYRKYKKLTEEQKKKISIAKKGRKNKPHSEETKKKISDSNIGKKFSEEHKNKLKIARAKRKTTQETRDKRSKTSKGNINIKKFILTDPDGKKYTTKHGLTKFCEEHNLGAPNMIKVANGQRKHHKGWKIKRL